jgi:hypothetical protein
MTDTLDEIDDHHVVASSSNGMGVSHPSASGTRHRTGGHPQNFSPDKKDETNQNGLKMTEQKKRGGARPGAGRKKGSVDRRFMQQPEQAEHYAGITGPLDYLLRVMRDEHADFRRRDRAAKAALKYTAAKLAPKSANS